MNPAYCVEFFRNDRDRSEYARVKKTAYSLYKYLQLQSTKDRIAAVNAVGVASQEVQACIVDHASSLGFQSEKKRLFANYRTSGLRPDYYLRLPTGNGILFEVERGKTLANNMDLLDIWKCHTCTQANYLFLLVPQERPDRHGQLRPVFPKVVDRMRSFFEESNYVNVYGLFVFGY